jgi:hypothetical protein
LQKLSLRRRAEPSERFGLLSCGGLVSSASEINREDGRTGGLREARTHFSIRRTESKNISFEGFRRE